ncbi:MAG: AmmeMemoRadiSam system protein B [Acidobacteriota bacterium]
MVRHPSVAGMFYPGDRTGLENDIKKYIDSAESGQKKDVTGLISPHAGYIYSGSCAGKGFAAVNIPDKVVILGVNHRGAGYSMAIDGNDIWETPLGNIKIDEQLRNSLVEVSDVFEIDSLPSEEEHSLEVQVPFIQYLNPDASILPITIASMNIENMKKGGEELASMIKNRDEKILMIASTDMSHYVSSALAEEKDSKAIREIIDLEPERLIKTVVEEKISMCGVSPTFILMVAAKKLGATAGEIIEYTNSGYTSGDFDQVVGYLSAVVY